MDRFWPTTPLLRTLSLAGLVSVSACGDDSRSGDTASASSIKE